MVGSTARRDERAPVPIGWRPYSAAILVPCTYANNAATRNLARTCLSSSVIGLQATDARSSPALWYLLLDDHIRVR